MWRAGTNGNVWGLRGEVVLLLLVSFFIVAALVVALLDAGAVPFSGRSSAILLMALMLGGAMLAAAAAWGAAHRRGGPHEGNAGRDRGAAPQPVDGRGHHQGRAAGAGLLGAGQDVRVVTHTLTSVAGLPRGARAAAALRRAGSSRRRPGAQAGARRAVRRRAVPSVCCSRRQPAATSRPTAAPPAAGRYCACATSPATRATSPACSTSTASCRASTRPARALLDALPMPVWLRARDGRIEWVNAAYVEGRRGAGQRGGARAPDRAARAAPARVGRQRRSPRAALSRKRVPLDHRRRAQGARCDRHAAGRGHVVAAAIDVAALETRARASSERHDRGLRPHARSRGDRRCHLRPRPAPDLLQRGLSQAVAARSRLARRPSRPTARSSTGCASCPACPRSVNYRDWKAKRARPATRPAPSTRTGGICPTAACCT